MAVTITCVAENVHAIVTLDDSVIVFLFTKRIAVSELGGFTNSFAAIRASVFPLLTANCLDDLEVFSFIIHSLSKTKTFSPGDVIIRIFVLSWVAGLFLSLSETKFLTRAFTEI